MFAIFKKELNSFLNSLLGYIVLAVFLTAIGLIFWVFPDTNVLDYGFADMGTFFNLTPYIFMFLVPAITMRAFADEVKTGTIELLLTKPLSLWQLVLGKFLASWALIGIALLPTLIYYYSVYQLGGPVGNIDSAAVWGAYIGLFLLGGVFAAIGVFTSALTDNQVVAFVLGVFVSFILYLGISSIAQLDFWESWRYTLSQFGLDTQYNALGKGLVDARNVVYLLSIMGAMLFFTKMKLQKG
jgi:ABC-2 type transport system permease protein